MRIVKLNDSTRQNILENLLKRSPNSYGRFEASVAEILANVKANKDAALFEYTEKFDKAHIDATNIRVTDAEIEEAYTLVEPKLLEVIRKALVNIRDYHMKQKQYSWFDSTEQGTILGQKVTPIEKVGVYVPGGKAVYPSSVLMNIVPAKVAGVSQIIMTTPPAANGKVNPSTLVAAKEAGVDVIYKVGGAQAIGALAYGTESIPKVDKIVGPGNIYVAEAKKEVSGIVSIDMIAGPSEILIIADGKSDERIVAADMLSQAEHDRNASAVLITDSQDLAEKVRAELEEQLPLLPRYDIARASIDTNGKIIIVDSISSAIEVSDRIAPEHLEVCVDNPFDYLDKIHNAGSVFLGRNCPEALGDYLAGPNHTLPTSGTARFSSPLSVDDFVKKYQFTYYTASALSIVASDVALFARREGLEAHARSALVRKGEGK